MKAISFIWLTVSFLQITASTNCQSFILQDAQLKADFNSRGLSSIICPTDPHAANALSRGGIIGSPHVRYKIGHGDWLDLHQGDTEYTTETDGTVKYSDFIEGMPIKMTQSFYLKNGILNYDMELQSMMNLPVTIGDLGIPFPWKKPKGENPQEIFEKSFVKHHYISGHGSWLLFTKPSGEGPMLLVTVKPGTKLEYFTGEGDYIAYIHSGLSGNRQINGTWRQEHSYLEMGSRGSESDHVKYGFQFQWVDNYDAAREAMVKAGGFDIRIVPGMTLPTNLTAKIAIRTNNTIESIIPEFPDQTQIKLNSDLSNGYHIYEVSFEKLGENILTIQYNDSLKTYLEFFCTEPLEILFKKRSDFIVNQQQHINPEKWYDGLFSIWDMKNQVLRGPENTDGYDHWWGYVLACDDPALCKAPYVAAKNEVYPVDEEIAALEYYLEHFVWGGLQRTDEEKPYPYGIYGTPNWMVNRDPIKRAGVKNRNLDKMNIWRSYDYPHIIMLYYHMYQIAKKYPDKVHYLDAEEYLERAAETAKAYFIYPYEILPWYETYKWGCYNELVILDLITELENSKTKDLKSEKWKLKTSQFLREEWEKKAKYFIYDDPYPFRSEYSLDRTAFESSYALAKYGVQNKMLPDSNLWYDKKLKKWYSHPEVSQKDARDFMDKQLQAGIACRGWLETKYFLLGSDFTSSSDSHCLSYMARMGGWGILDYAFEFAQKPDDYLQLGYASYLSSWALMNTGTEDTNYGYWFPGQKNDGATGWAFMASKHGRAWIRKNEDRGAWRYDGEADLGYGAAVRMATTVLSYDSIFGWMAYGGKLDEKIGEFEIIPRDGLRKRFDIRTDDLWIHVEVNRDGFSKEIPIKVNHKLNQIELSLENRTGDQHITEILIKCNIPSKIELISKGKRQQSKGRKTQWIFEVPSSKSQNKIIIRLK